MPTIATLHWIRDAQLAEGCAGLPWRPPAPGEVQVWCLPEAPLAVACAAVRTTLSDDELRRADRYRRAGDARWFVARRGLLRLLLGRLCGGDAAAVQFAASADGKPALLAPSDTGLGFGVAQTEGMSVLAIGRSVDIGIDVERRVDGPDLFGLAEEVFSAEEQRVLRDADPTHRAAQFFATWARKEALLKALGVGLSGEPRRYTTEAGAQAPCWTARHDDAVLSGWTLLDLDLGPAHHAALAARPIVGA